MTERLNSPFPPVAALGMDAVTFMVMVIVVTLALQLQRTPDTDEVFATGTASATADRPVIDTTITVTDAGVFLDRNPLPGGLADLPAQLEAFRDSTGIIALCFRRDDMAAFWETIFAAETATGRAPRNICFGPTG